MDRNDGDDPMHGISDQDFLISLLNSEQKNGLAGQNPMMSGYSNQNLFQLGEVGYSGAAAAAAAGLGGGNSYTQYHNLEDISKYLPTQNANTGQGSSGNGLGETTDYYSQHMRKNVQGNQYSLPNAQHMQQQQSQQQHQNSHLNAHFHQQQQHIQNTSGYMYHQPQQQQSAGVKQEINGLNQLPKLEDQAINDFTSLYSQQGALKRPEQLLEKNKNLFNYKNNLKNTYINKISTLMTDAQQVSKSQERQQQEQLIQHQQPIQWLPKDPKQQADEIFKEPLKPPPQGFPYQIQAMQVMQNMGGMQNIIQHGQNINSNFKLPIHANLQMNPQQVQQQLKKVRSFEKSEEYEKINQKLVRNRESARNSRKRKKIFIELLEHKVASISEELEKTKRVLETNNQYLNKLSLQTQILNGFIFGRQQLYEKIEKQITLNAEENEINLLLDSLRFRLGAAGKERITAMNYFFKQILDICIPTHFRYLLQTAQDGTDIFNEGNSFDDEKRAPWRQELLNTLALSESQKKQLQKFKKRFVGEKQKLDELIDNLQGIKKQIHEKTLNVEKIIDDMRGNFNPYQLAKFLLYLEKNKYRREISNSNLWEILKKDGGEYDFDEEAQSEQNLINIHLLETQTNNNLNNSNSANGPNDTIQGGFHLTTNFSNNNLAGLQHSLEIHDLHNISDELHRDILHGNDEDEDDEEEEDEDDDDSHLHKIKHPKGSRKKKQILSRDNNAGFI